ncbi:MAG: hypothetical protein KGO82_19615, partial [Bacteroidota bacterium]|nr:hypothetical protein [Bacteroidota bacterium]
GMGIGLYISQEIIQRHQGKLWAESIPGKGSTFLFSIPAVVQHEAARIPPGNSVEAV